VSVASIWRRIAAAGLTTVLKVFDGSTRDETLGGLTLLKGRADRK